jgi:hypothetical protein
MANKKAEASAKATMNADTASRLIDAKITEQGDWRGATLARVRHLIHEASGDMSRR